MTGRGRNVAASIRERLRRYSAAGSGGYLVTLQRYAIERLLYRLSESPRRDEFVLKGAVLLRLWGEKASRVTRDLDLLGAGPASPEDVAKSFARILAARVEPDGLEFPAGTLRASQILAGQEYVGVRLKLEAHLERARIPLQVDIGFGDSVFPRPSLAEFPSLLDGPRPRIRVYSRESVIAEKLHAMVRHGEDNTRAKDFYDVFVLSSLLEFDGPTLSRSIELTFRRRATPLPSEPPISFSPGWYQDDDRAMRWRKYLERDRLAGAPVAFGAVGGRIRDFLWPLLSCLKDTVPFRKSWRMPEGWR